MIEHPKKNSFQIALYEPEIPANTGNIIRLCACLGVKLHLIHPLGFNFDDKHLKRAGLDYHDLTDIKHHVSFGSFLEEHPLEHLWGLTTKTSESYWSVSYSSQDILIFGPETRGLPASVLLMMQKRLIKIPMVASARSLNLSNAVSIVAYEAARQLNTFI